MSIGRHRELCLKISDQLKKGKIKIRSESRFYTMVKCPVVLCEIVSFAASNPDVLGFSGNRSTYNIEVKTSVADFKSDKLKNCHRLNRTMGRFKYYLCENEIIRPEMIKNGWGLIYFGEKESSVIKKSEDFFKSNKWCFQDEQLILMSIFRRAGLDKNIITTNLFKK